MKSFLKWTHDMTCLDHTISDAQKRCDMRIIGFDKESRPVLYFCVLSSVERMGFFPKTHTMRTAFY